MIFVDTSAWFSAFVPGDSHYTAANAWRTANQATLVTTDYIIDELLTLLLSRGKRSAAIKLGHGLFSQSLAKLEWVSESDVRQAWTIFERYQDKGWSFTDCTSKVVIEKFHIKRALTFDRHFAEFGAIELLP